MDYQSNTNRPTMPSPIYLKNRKYKFRDNGALFGERDIDSGAPLRIRSCSTFIQYLHQARWKALYADDTGRLFKNDNTYVINRNPQTNLTKIEDWIGDTSANFSRPRKQHSSAIHKIDGTADHHSIKSRLQTIVPFPGGIRLYLSQ